MPELLKESAREEEAIQNDPTPVMVDETDTPEMAEDAVETVDADAPAEEEV